VTAEYRPGTCNIGQTERRLRYGFAVVGFALAATIVLAVALYSFPRWVLLLSAVPLFGGFLSYFQGREGFCVGYAVAGIYNVGDGVGDHGTVSTDEAVRRDRRNALRLLVRAALPAIVVTLLLYVLLPT
jgi:hypothetical protein